MKVDDDEDDEDNGKCVIRQIYKFFKLPEFDPAHVVRCARENKIFVELCYSMTEHAIIKRIGQVGDELCEYTVTDFDEDYIEDLLLLFVNNRIVINFHDCSRIFRKCFSRLMMDRYPDMAIRLEMNNLAFIRNGDCEPYIIRGLIADMHEILLADPNPKNVDDMCDLIREAIATTEGGEWLRPSLELISEINPSIKFSSKYRCYEYLFGNMFEMKLTIGNDENEDIEDDTEITPRKIIDLNNIEEVITAYIDNPKSNDERQIIDQMYCLAKDRHNAALLSGTDNKLLQWIAGDRSMNTKSSRK